MSLPRPRLSGSAPAPERIRKANRTRLITLGVLLSIVVGLPIIAITAPMFLPHHCIAKGTLVDTPAGPRAIEDLRDGDAIVCRGPRGDRIGRVLATRPAWSVGSRRIRFSDGSVLEATESHRVSTPGGWREVGALARGMQVDGRESALTVVDIDRSYGWARVYDLEVGPDPNFIAAGIRVHNKSGAERNAATSLKTLATAQTDFRSNDRDGNRINDFWVGDVAGLYTLPDSAGQPIRLIELSVAGADAAPLVDISKHTRRMAIAGYLFAVIPLQADGTPYDDGSHRNPSAFGFCAFLEQPTSSGYTTLIINENNTIFRRIDHKPGRIKKWPTDEELAREWSKMD